MRAVKIYALTLLAAACILCSSSSFLYSQPAHIAQVVPAEYRVWYIMTDGTIWGYNNWSPLAVQFSIGGMKTIGGSGGFNYFRMLDTQGYLWTDVTFNVNYSANNATRTDIDATGASFSGNWFINAYGNVYATIRADSSIWYGGNDVYSLFYPGGDEINGSTGVAMAPTKLSPAGMKFKKVLFGGTRIVALTTSGQVYQWLANGSRTPTLMATPRPATDIFVSASDVAGCIVPDPGETSGMGYPFVWGTSTSMYGGGAPSTQPISIKAQWNMTVPIKEMAVTWNTMHYIDSLGRMYGIGFNSMGEVGNGQEFVNKYNYPGFPGYGWTFQSYENPSGAPPTQIGVGITWKHLYSNNWFCFYNYAQDANDSIYSWGRNKGLALGNGMENMQEQYSCDALDVLKPTMVHPLSQQFTQYNFTPPGINVGPKQTIAASTASLACVATAPLLYKATATAPNGLDKAGYNIISYQWTQVGGNAASITSPNAANTTVTGLRTGTYVFQVITTDNNTGTLMARDTIVVTGTTGTAPVPPTVTAGSAQTLAASAATTTLTGTATANGGATITSTAWTELSGPNTAAIANPSSLSTTVSGLIPGTYIFQLKATDNNNQSTVSTNSVTLPSASASPTGNSIPGIVQAENYSAMFDVQTQATTDAGGGLNVGWIYQGSSMTYAVTAAVAGTYTVGFRISTPNTGASLQLKNAAGAVLAAVNLPNTGSWATWQTVTATVSLPAGSQSLQVVSTGTAMWNINWMDFETTAPIPAPTGNVIPGVVQAENYATMFNIQTQATSDAGGGQNVGWINQGSWMKYAVNVAAAGSYTVGFRISTPNTGASLQLKNAAGTVLATVNLPNTGSWATWQTVTTTISLPAGSQTLQVVSTSIAMWNINWMDFENAGSQAQAAVAQDLSSTAAIAESLPALVPSLTLYPNPTPGTVTLNIENSHTGKMIVQVIDPSGAVKKTYSLNKEDQRSSTTLNIGDLAAGVYLIRIQMAGWSEVQKLLKL